MQLNDYLRVLRKFWISVVAVTIAGLSLAAIYSLLVTPTYTANTSLFVTVQNASSASDLNNGSSYAERQVKSFAQVAETPLVLQPVIDKLGLGVTPEQLTKSITVSVPTNTSLLDVAVVDKDPNRAAAVAGGIADSLVKAVVTVAPKDQNGHAAVDVTIVTPAAVPTSWTSPKVAQNLLLGLLVGLLLGVGQALGRHALDTKVRNAEDVAAITDVPVIGTVAWDADAANNPLIALTDRNSLRAEEYRRLRTNLQFLRVDDKPRVIAFSSSVAAEGKTITVTNVALALAAAGKRVLLLDADLRRPRVAHRLGLEGAAGLTTVLVGGATLADVIQPMQGLDVLASGPVPPNPSELLGSDAMRSLLREVGSRYDYVLVDAAPLVAVADTAVLSSLISGVIVIVGSGQVDAAELEDALQAVGAAEGHVLGLVVNKLRVEDAGARRNHHYYREAYADSTPPKHTEDPARETLINARPREGCFGG